MIGSEILNLISMHPGGTQFPSLSQPVKLFLGAKFFIWRKFWTGLYAETVFH